MQAVDLIGIDWGSSSFRAWAMARDGSVIDSVVAARGLKSVQNRAFEQVVMDECGDWLTAAPECPVILSGMVGSRTGWIEAEYVPCPVDSAALTRGAARFTIAGHPAAILPGACVVTESGDTDVVRGEEAQVLGVAAETCLTDAVICIPGTHSKWLRLEGGRLAHFETYVTGELFQLLRHQSLVGALADGDAFDRDAFRRGLGRGAEHALSHAVFAARANTLQGRLAPTAVSSYLSGVLIGTEIAAKKRPHEVVLMATGVLADSYCFALELSGHAVRRIDARDAARTGLVLAARELWADRVGT